MSKRGPAKVPPRERIVRAAADLLRSGGFGAVSTRAVSAAAGVQAPAIYRQFGDMNGLLEAAAREMLAEYVRAKATRVDSDDPLEDLRRGWDEHIAFGMTNPAAYGILYGSRVDVDDPTSRAGYAILERLVGRLAEAGRLRVSVATAAGLIHAAGKGVTLSLISLPEEHRDPALAELMREAVIAAIVPSAATKATRSGERVASRAVALRSVLHEAPDVLSTGEHHLFVELLDKLATSASLKPGRAPTRR